MDRAPPRSVTQRNIPLQTDQNCLRVAPQPLNPDPTVSTVQPLCFCNSPIRRTYALASLEFRLELHRSAVDRFPAATEFSASTKPRPARTVTVARARLVTMSHDRRRLACRRPVGFLPHVAHIPPRDVTRHRFRSLRPLLENLAEALRHGDIDPGFLRIQPRPAGVSRKSPSVVLLPSDHRLAAEPAIDLVDPKDEIVLGFSAMPHVLRDVVDDDLALGSVDITPSHRR